MADSTPTPKPADVDKPPCTCMVTPGVLILDPFCPGNELHREAAVCDEEPVYG